jgi:hypothetical protein
MHYLPARCDACSFAVLVPQHVHGTVLGKCAKCGAEVTIFPGAKHQAHERALFAELSESVHATVSPGSATACLSNIEDLTHDAPASILSMVTARLPALTKVVVSAKSSTSAASVAAMLLTILRARSSMRSHSGFIVSCGFVAPASESLAPPSTRRSSASR